MRNQFLVRLVNKRSGPAALLVAVRGLPAGATAAGLEAPVTLAALGEEVRPLIVQLPRSRYTAPFRFEVEVRDPAGTFTLERSLEFLGPESFSTLRRSPARLAPPSLRPRGAGRRESA